MNLTIFFWLIDCVSPIDSVLWVAITVFLTKTVLHLIIFFKDEDDFDLKMFHKSLSISLILSLILAILPSQKALILMTRKDLCANVEKESEQDYRCRLMNKQLIELEDKILK